MDEEPAQQKVRKISISLSNDVLDWVLREKGDLKVSTFINQILRESMEHGKDNYIREEFAMLKQRLKKLEEDIHDLREVRSLNAGKLGRAEHISILSTRPKDVFGELVSIKNVSAANASAVREELIHFMRGREYIDRPVVLDELFPHTRSTITNRINYWYNACRGVLDHLIEEGFVVRLGKDKYRWIGDRKQD
ncbi:MAG TPA: hypothetical protein VMC84_13370 [Methanocella sp.]|uniref:hypothetical protein n=1 Tax=Methanocella sp. TaxID=2052833 RepID=UPI002C587983|nr:hypothetical protein [Methanocella sp.]HTY92159.1 hypothetical protein [Methanocella sp.]